MHGGAVAIFISYSRTDKSIVTTLCRDLETAGNMVWMDHELTGGQSWWDAILGEIRDSSLFVFALGPDSLNSRACQAELGYAVALGKPILPVMVDDVSIELAPPVISNAQVTDFRERTTDSVLLLVRAVSLPRQSRPLPEPLPPEPPPPLSYMNEYHDRLAQTDLSFREQSQLVFELQSHLRDPEERDIATELLRKLRNRRDIVESVGVEVDRLLADPTGTRDTARSVDGPAPGWYRDPTGRFVQRYWNGSVWTEHVSTRGQQSTDPI
jgi:hypothetical protein